MDFDLNVDIDETLDGLIPSREEADDQEERVAAERPGAVDIQESSDPLEERGEHQWLAREQPPASWQRGEP